MFMSRRHSFPVSAVGLILVVCLAVRPTMNARDSGEVFRDPGLDSRAESLFRSATELIHLLQDRPLDDRAARDYRMALDACNQVVRLGVDSRLSAESLARAAELTREMADASGDNQLYRQSIESFRKIVANYPDSNLVGNALVSIAQISEENIQDLDGAAAAYEEIIRLFPFSVIAREARAVLSRIRTQLDAHGPLADVHALATGRIEQFDTIHLNNVRSFSGADYARVVLDLSGQPSYSQETLAPNRIVIKLTGAYVASELEGRRLVVEEPHLLKRISVSQRSAGKVEVELQVATNSKWSLATISSPERLVVDIHSGESALRRPQPETGVSEPSVRSYEARRSYNTGAAGAILSLPEIADPILAGNEAGISTTTAGIATAASPVKCIVIDPGHGGHDTGTIGAGGLREKDLVLDVARRLRAYIKNNFPGIEVILTRDSDRFIALEQRTAIANSRRADLFISIHANASLSRVASGVETFFVSPDRAAQFPGGGSGAEPAGATPSDEGESDATSGRSDARTDKPEAVYASVSVGNRITASRDLARYIQAGLVRGIGTASPRTATNRGVKHAPFAVLVGSAMPSVLAEVSFVSNRRDEGLLSTSQFRERIAASLFAGLRAYLKRNTPKEKV